jgi:hypothetical protein
MTLEMSMQIQKYLTGDDGTGRARHDLFLSACAIFSNNGHFPFD